MKSVLHDISRSEVFTQISDICSTVTSVTDTKELLKLSLKKIINFFGATRGSIFILDENGKDLLLETSTGMDQKEEEGMIKQMGEGIVGRVAQLKQPLFVSDITKDKRFDHYQKRRSYSTPSFICTPLMIKDQLIGVINIADKESGKNFTQEDLELLDFLTAQIALNYRRIQLMNKFKTAIKEKEVLENQLGQSTKETKKLQKQVDIHAKLATIGKLAGGIAHEFNNPLDGVLRYTNLSLDLVDDEDVVHGYLLEIRQGLKRMANIVKNLLACSRNEFNDNVQIDLKFVLEHILKNKKVDLDHKGIKVDLDVSDDLPRLKDYGLERVLTNLISNAIDAVEKDGKIDIKIWADASQNIYIRVQDNGCGIQAEDIDEIFEPFYTTKEMESGCGLGLTIVGEIIKFYHGILNVESKEDEGTVFTVSLPRSGYIEAKQTRI